MHGDEAIFLILLYTLVRRRSLNKYLNLFEFSFEFAEIFVIENQLYRYQRFLKSPVIAITLPKKLTY
jgi:hypothetical protein